jgi:facilitated trehalose transporter
MAIFIGAALQYLEVMNGCTSITSYSETIFREAGSTLSPALSTVIMGVIFLIGSYISATFVDKAGRKVLMIASATGCGINLSIVAGYSYLRHLDFDVSTFGWIPLCCLSLFMLLASVGVISLHMVISSEILSQKIRGPVLSFFIIENWMISFVAVKVRRLDNEFCDLMTFFLVSVLPDISGIPRNAWLHVDLCAHVFWRRLVRSNGVAGNQGQKH